MTSYEMSNTNETIKVCPEMSKVVKTVDRDYGKDIFYLYKVFCLKEECGQYDTFSGKCSKVNINKAISNLNKTIMQKRF